MARSSKLFWLSVALYVASLVTPVQRVSDSFGIMYLLVGWAGMFMPQFPAHWAWLANVSLFATWRVVAVGAYVPARILSLVSLALAVLYRFCSEAVTNEGGVPTPISSYGPGYYLWLGSMVAATFAAFVGGRKFIPR
jgi:hypothetical protein